MCVQHEGLQTVFTLYNLVFVRNLRRLTSQRYLTTHELIQFFVFSITLMRLSEAAGYLCWIHSGFPPVDPEFSCSAESSQSDSASACGGEEMKTDIRYVSACRCVSRFKSPPSCGCSSCCQVIFHYRKCDTHLSAVERSPPSSYLRGCIRPQVGTWPKT